MRSSAKNLRAVLMIVKLLLDPRVFNYVIMVLYALNIARWWFAGSTKDALYWGSALCITATVTFMYEH